MRRLLIFILGATLIAPANAQEVERYICSPEETIALKFSSGGVKTFENYEYDDKKIFEVKPFRAEDLGANAERWLELTNSKKDPELVAVDMGTLNSFYIYFCFEGFRGKTMECSSIFGEFKMDRDDLKYFRTETNISRGRVMVSGGSCHKY